MITPVLFYILNICAQPAMTKPIMIFHFLKLKIFFIYIDWVELIFF